jgi:hypothetical protein
MSVSSAIEIAGSGGSTKALGATGLGQQGSTAAGAASFRSGWQSLLASLGVNMDSLEGAEGQTAEANTSAKLTAGSALAQDIVAQNSKQGSGQAVKTSLANSLPASSPARSATKATVSSSKANQTPTAVSIVAASSESTHTAHSTSATKSTAVEDASLTASAVSQPEVAVSSLPAVIATPVSLPKLMMESSETPSSSTESWSAKSPSLSIGLLAPSAVSAVDPSSSDLLPQASSVPLATESSTIAAPPSLAAGNLSAVVSASRTLASQSGAQAVASQAGEEISSSEQTGWSSSLRENAAAASEGETASAPRAQSSVMPESNLIVSEKTEFTSSQPLETAHPAAPQALAARASLPSSASSTDVASDFVSSNKLASTADSSTSSQVQIASAVTENALVSGKTNSTVASQTSLTAASSESWRFSQADVMPSAASSTDSASDSTLSGTLVSTAGSVTLNKTQIASADPSDSLVTEKKNFTVASQNPSTETRSNFWSFSQADVLSSAASSTDSASDSASSARLDSTSAHSTTSQAALASASANVQASTATKPQSEQASLSSTRSQTESAVAHTAPTLSASGRLVASDGLASSTSAEISSSSRPAAVLTGAAQLLPQGQSTIPEANHTVTNQSVAVPVGGEVVQGSPTVGDQAAYGSGSSREVASIQGQTTSTGSVRGNASSTQRTSRGSASSGGAQQGALFGQSVSAAVDATGLARDVATSHGGSPTSAESGGTSAKSATGVSDPFAALDSEASRSATATGRTSSRQAEAGFQDPDLGWVGVRANSSGEGIHASLVPTSAEAGQSLGGHLAGLNTYLDEHHTPVESLTVATPESQSNGMGTNQGTGEQSGQQNAQSGGSSSPDLSSEDSNSATDSAVDAALQAGSHISVMA